jgi:hypothetical protein
MKNLKIKKEYIGSKVKSVLFGKWFTIEVGNEQVYWDAGLFDIFEQEKPVIKVKKNVKNREESTEHIGSDSVGTDDNSSSELSF